MLKDGDNDFILQWCNEFKPNLWRLRGSVYEQFREQKFSVIKRLIPVLNCWFNVLDFLNCDKDEI